MPESHLETVNFDIIRYANCWEDPEVLLAGLRVDESSTVMSIASAGDNCFSLLTANPQRVIAVDISAVQLFLVELKKVAMLRFDYTEFMEFCGFTPSKKRGSLFALIKKDLSEACRTYWSGQAEAIEKGIIHAGKFEKYFQLFKNEVLPTVHTQETVNKLLKLKTAAEQIDFHDRIWHTSKWQTMYRHFFGHEMMGTHGRDPAFLKHVKGSVPDLILAREVAHLRTVRAQKNYFLHYILNNRFDLAYLPHYVRKENFELIKSRLNRLELHHGLLDAALQKYDNCSHFNLSDIFEYMDDELFRKTAKNLLKYSAPKARFGYWNLMIPRLMAAEYPTKINHLKETSNTLKELDNGYFYGALVFEEKK